MNDQVRTGDQQWQPSVTTSRGLEQFSATQPVGAIVGPGCHECLCDELFPKVMERVLRVKNMCSDDICTIDDSRDNYDSFRRRNQAISSDYARIYLQPLGEAQRLKFAAGAAFGSTHIGFGLDLAAETLRNWGHPGERAANPYFMLERLMSEALASVGQQATQTGLRRLFYGNLAIYMDLGAVLWFCQMHEERFNFFRDGRVDEFLECFERFTLYVRSEHASDHPVYGPHGSFGADSDGWLKDGLRAIAQNNLGNSLSIIDHEQRIILQDFMYELNLFAVGRDDARLLGDDADFKHFMNALEEVERRLPFRGADGSSVGDDPRFNGIRAVFSADTIPHRLAVREISHAGQRFVTFSDQPLIFPFIPSKYGWDFSDPDVRTPWFQDVVRHYMNVEENTYGWPDGRPTSPYRSLVWGHGRSGYQDLAIAHPDLNALLLADLRSIRGRG